MEARGSSSGSLWWPDSMLRHLMLVFPFIFHQFVVLSKFGSVMCPHNTFFEIATEELLTLMYLKRFHFLL